MSKQLVRIAVVALLVLTFVIISCEAFSHFHIKKFSFDTQYIDSYCSALSEVEKDPNILDSCEQVNFDLEKNEIGSLSEFILLVESKSISISDAGLMRNSAMPECYKGGAEELQFSEIILETSVLSDYEECYKSFNVLHCYRSPQSGRSLHSLIWKALLDIYLLQVTRDKDGHTTLKWLVEYGKTNLQNPSAEAYYNIFGLVSNLYFLITCPEFIANLPKADKVLLMEWLSRVSQHDFIMAFRQFEIACLIKEKTCFADIHDPECLAVLTAQSIFGANDQFPMTRTVEWRVLNYLDQERSFHIESVIIPELRILDYTIKTMKTYHIELHKIINEMLSILLLELE